MSAEIVYILLALVFLIAAYMKFLHARRMVRLARARQEWSALATQLFDPELEKQLSKREFRKGKQAVFTICTEWPLSPLLFTQYVVQVVDKMTGGESWVGFFMERILRRDTKPMARDWYISLHEQVEEAVNITTPLHIVTLDRIASLRYGQSIDVMRTLAYHFAFQYIPALSATPVIKMPNVRNIDWFRDAGFHIAWVLTWDRQVFGKLQERFESTLAFLGNAPNIKQVRDTMAELRVALHPR